MREVKGHGCRGTADVEHGDDPLQFVMPRLVADVAEPDHTSRLTGEIECQSRGTAAKQARDRIQFLAAIAQVVPSYDEIGSAESGAGRKQNAILAVPESSVAGRFW